MIIGNDFANKRMPGCTGARKAVRKVFALLTLLLFMISAAALPSAAAVYAAGTDIGAEKPIREVHKVKAGDEKYCFFVTHNVVLTPEDIVEMTDEELTADILGRSGLFMKKTNCKKPAHKIITMSKWKRSGKSLYLSDSDIADIRAAEPVDGEPVKLHMDLRISTGDEDEDEQDIVVQGDETADGEGGDPQDEDGEDGSDEDGSDEEKVSDKGYSTFKRTSPRLLFVCVATETDAAYGDDICVEDSEENPDKPGKGLPSGKGGGGKKEILPEYRTISMVDRTGAPLEETLKDGSPVTLEWIEPSVKSEDAESRYLFGFIPARIACLGLIAALIAALAAFAAVAARRRREQQ